MVSTIWAYIVADDDSEAQIWFSGLQKLLMLTFHYWKTLYLQVWQYCDLFAEQNGLFESNTFGIKPNADEDCCRYQNHPQSFLKPLTTTQGHWYRL